MAKKKIYDLEMVKSLAMSGHTHLQIAKALNISKTTLYARSDISDAIKEAETDLRQKVAQDLLDRSGSDLSSASSIFLAKRLNLYSTTYHMPQIRSVKSALTQISRVNSDLASGTIPSELASALIKNIQTFLSAYETNELEIRVEQIEKTLQERKKKKGWR